MISFVALTPEQFERGVVETVAAIRALVGPQVDNPEPRTPDERAPFVVLLGRAYGLRPAAAVDGSGARTFRRAWAELDREAGVVEDMLGPYALRIPLDLMAARHYLTTLAVTRH